MAARTSLLGAPLEAPSARGQEFLCLPPGGTSETLGSFLLHACVSLTLPTLEQLATERRTGARVLR